MDADDVRNSDATTHGSTEEALLKLNGLLSRSVARHRASATFDVRVQSQAVLVAGPDVVGIRKDGEELHEKNYTRRITRKAYSICHSR